MTGTGTLSIYDVRGVLVTQYPVHGTATAPHMSVSWDGCDTKQHPVSQGIYFVHLTLQCGNETINRRAKLIKLH
jgi:hypothetical protein